MNGKSRLLHFDWLFQTFWHWWALLSRCTEPEHAKLIRIFEWNGPCGSGHSSGPMEGYTYIYYNPFLYILRKGPAHIVQWPTGKTPGAPDGQSATAWRHKISFQNICIHCSLLLEWSSHSHLECQIFKRQLFSSVSLTASYLKIKIQCFHFPLILHCSNLYYSKQCLTFCIMSTN